MTFSWFVFQTAPHFRRTVATSHPGSLAPGSIAPFAGWWTRGSRVLLNLLTLPESVAGCTRTEEAVLVEIRTFLEEYHERMLTDRPVGDPSAPFTDATLRSNKKQRR